MENEELCPGRESDSDDLSRIISRGQEVLRRVVKDPDTYYYFCCQKLGDTVYTLGFACAVARRCGFRRLLAVLKPEHEMFGKFYAHRFDRMIINSEDMDAFEFFCQVSQVYQGENWMYAFIRWTLAEGQENRLFDLDLPGTTRRLSFYDRYRWAFGLPRRTRHDPMRIQPPPGMREELAARFGLNRERTIILMPYSYSWLMRIDRSFWEILAQELIENGYQVYTNVGYDNERPLPGTMPMHTTFEELYCVSQSIRAFISERSGITDFLASIGGPQIVLSASIRLSLMRDYVASAEELGVPCRTIQLSLNGASFYWLISVIEAMIRCPIQEYLLPEPED